MMDLLNRLPESYQDVDNDTLAEDMEAFKAEAWRLRLWRASPKASIGAEFLRVAMSPNWVNKRREKTPHGIGCENTEKITAGP
eukprot:5696512-Pyramimonas_sp.AAC.1